MLGSIGFFERRPPEFGTVEKKLKQKNETRSASLAIGKKIYD
ncbi:hypothetical protein [Microcoleus vaginatus]